MVNVYRLITRGTLEEKIMGLQKFKMNIANTVISQENSSLQSMGTDQLLDLFTLDKVKNLYNFCIYNMCSQTSWHYLVKVLKGAAKVFTLVSTR